MTQRSVRSMISMERMLSRKEWVVEVVDMTRLTYSSPSLVATLLAVRIFSHDDIHAVVYQTYMEICAEFCCAQVVEVAEAVGRGGERM